MIHKKGDLFTSDVVALGHGVNIAGLMGAGIAKTFKEKYPDNYYVYSQQCRVKGLRPGGALIVPAAETDIKSPHVERLIVNIASQDAPGPNARYEWVLKGALAAAKQLMSLGVFTCALPRIASDIGGLEWDKVQCLLVAVEDMVPGFEWEVWEFAPQIDIDNAVGIVVR